MVNQTNNSIKRTFIYALLSGLLLPLGFAPFHLPGFIFIGVACLFYLLTPSLSQNHHSLSLKTAFFIGFFFGLGYLGLGVSWVYNSVHDYGHLNALLSAAITLLFIAFLSLYLGLFSYLYAILSNRSTILLNCFLFSSIWCLCEYLRSTLFGGFPWLLIGYSQMDTPLRYLLPIIGIFGVGFTITLLSSFLIVFFKQKKLASLPWIIAFVGLLLSPLLLKHKSWTTQQTKAIDMSIIQANLSMKDKWDEALFLNLLQYYKKQTSQLLHKKRIVVLPESAIPAPDSYVTDFIESLHYNALKTQSAILMGIPTELPDNIYYNSLVAIGNAEGTYHKRHLVPFGEFIPGSFKKVASWLSIPITDMTPGKHGQPLVQVENHPIATLICYELAYPNLLREQLPESEWIVSISDDGWFGRSFAIYQQLQMASALSLQTGRYQIVANNDGLSSIINTQGEIVRSLPVHNSGILNGKIYAATGASPWVLLGDMPILILVSLLVIIAIARRTIASETQESEELTFTL